MILNKPFIAIAITFMIFATGTALLFDENKDWKQKLEKMDFLFLTDSSDDERAVSQLQEDIELLSGKSARQINDFSQLLLTLTDPTILGSYIQEKSHLDKQINSIADKLIELFKHRCDRIAQSKKVVIGFDEFISRIRRVNQLSVVFQIKKQLGQSSISIAKENWLQTLINVLTEKIYKTLPRECAIDTEKLISSAFGKETQNFKNDVERLETLGKLIVHPHFVLLDALKFMVCAMQDKNLPSKAYETFYKPRIDLIVEVMKKIRMDENLKSFFLSQYSYLIRLLIQDLNHWENAAIAESQIDTVEVLHEFYGPIIKNLAQIVTIQNKDSSEKIANVLVSYFKNHLKHTTTPSFKTNLAHWYKSSLAGKFNSIGIANTDGQEVHSLKIINVAFNLANTKEILPEDRLAFIDSFDQIIKIDPFWYSILTKINLMFDQLGLGAFDNEPEMFAAAMDAVFAMFNFVNRSELSANDLPKFWDAFLSETEILPVETQKYSLILKIINFMSHTEVIDLLKAGKVSEEAKKIATKILSAQHTFEITRNLSVLINSVPQSSTNSQLSNLEGSTQKHIFRSSTQETLIPPSNIVEWLAFGNQIKFHPIKLKSSKLII